MQLILMVLLCLLASIGLAQCVVWLLDRRKTPSGLRRGYHIIPLYDNPASLEAQLRYGVSCLGWARSGCPVVILVDMGLSPESSAVCEHFVRENPGLLRCEANTLPHTLRALDLILYPELSELSSDQTQTNQEV